MWPGSSAECADRVLVDVDDLVALVKALDARVLARHDARAVELVGEHRVEDRVHQGRFAGAGDAGDHSHHAKGEIDGDVLQIVLPCPHHAKALRGMRLAPHGRHLDAPSAGDVIAGDGPGRLDEALRRTGVNHLAAVLAGTGADVDHPIRPLDGFLIVFDDNQRVAEVAQMVQRLDETRVVTLVQSDRWLVEHVHDADQSGADLRGKLMRWASPPDSVLAARDSVR